MKTTSFIKGIKLLIASGALVLTLLLWNIFSSKALEDTYNSQNSQNGIPDGGGNTLINLAPLPTLVPVTFNLPESNPVAPVSNTDMAPAVQPTASLRKVSVPTAATPQKPIIHQVTIIQPGNNGGNSTNLQPAPAAPAATTGSSK